MPKVKPTWVCQHCERQFTTKYSLMRHFRRFPQHSPPHLSPGDADIKPITVKVNDHVRTVTAIPHSMVSSSSSHEDGTRHKHIKLHQEEEDDEDDEELADSLSTSESNARTTHPGSAFSLRNVSDTEESPSSAEFDFEESPDTIDVYTGKKNFPFLPSFLEDEQVLDIATPQHSSHSPVPPACSASDPSRLLSSPLSAHYSWAFARDAATTEHGQALLSPLTPACATNFRQVFQEEEEKLERLAASSKLRSPVELAALDQSLLLGDEEATSPFTFLEKTASHEPILPVSTALDFLSPPYHNESSSSSSSSAHEISMDDLDLGRFYAPMV
jgi:hypothetical protein